ncbi:hypothetical protein WG909_13950 [Peptostreptococcaceae bacterium AGR-M142]
MHIFTGDKRVGKSFILRNLSFLLSKNNKKIALIDLNNNNDLFDFFKVNSCNELPNDASKSLYENLICILEKPLFCYKNIDIYTSNKYLDDGDFFSIFDFYEEFKSNYDYVFIDCSLRSFKKLFEFKNIAFKNQDFKFFANLILDQRVVTDELKEISLFKNFDSIIFNKYLNSRFDDEKLLNMLNLNDYDLSKIFYINYDLSNEQEDLNNYFKNKELKNFDKDLKNQLSTYADNFLGFKIQKKSFFNIL